MTIQISFGSRESGVQIAPGGPEMRLGAGNWSFEVVWPLEAMIDIDDIY